MRGRKEREGQQEVHVHVGEMPWKGFTHIFEEGAISHCLLPDPGMLHWSGELHFRGSEGEMRRKVSKRITYTSTCVPDPLIRPASHV